MMAAVLPKPGLPPADLPVPLARVLAGLLDGLRPLPARTLPVSEAPGLVLAAPLVVPSPVPERPIALRRGYPVASADTTGAGPYSPLPLPGTPAIVMPGDALPDGSDAVLAEDAVLTAGGLAEAHEAAAPGRWVRRVGEDAPSGAVLRQTGQVLRRTDVALAQAARITACEVRRPRVLFAGHHAGPAARLIAELAAGAGAQALTSDVDVLRPEESGELVFILGAVAQQLDRLSAAGARVIARRLALRPGEDGAAIRLGRVPVLLAPDRSADALGLWLALGLPLVRHLAGASPSVRQELPLTRKVNSSVGVSEVALLRMTDAGYEPLGTGALPLAAIATSDSWLILPPESEGFAAADRVGAERIAP